MILPYSKVFKTLKEAFAVTNFATESIHEYTRWLSPIAWLARDMGTAG